MKTILIMAALVVATATPVAAQSPAPAFKGVGFTQKAKPTTPAKPAPQKQTTVAEPNMFGNDKAACEKALALGKFRYYEPRYLSGHDENPLKAGDEVIPLEKDMCIRLKTTSGMQYVVQKEGDEFRAHKLADGTFILFARDDCGNRCDDTPMGEPPPPPTSAPAVPQTSTTPPAVTRAPLNLTFTSVTDNSVTNNVTNLLGDLKRSWWKGQGPWWVTALVTTAILVVKYWPHPPNGTSCPTTGCG